MEIEAMTDNEVIEELAKLSGRFTKADFDRLEFQLRIRAACLHWTGNPLKMPPRAVLIEARAIVDYEMHGQLKSRVAQILTEGFWFCYGCDRSCERIEGEQGQPAHCSRCKSPRIEYHPPAFAL